MSKFKVGCSPLTSRLFAGNVLKNGMWGNVKHDVTDTAVLAVAQHLMQLNETVQFDCKGETYRMEVTKVVDHNKEFCICEIKGSSFQLDNGTICCCKCEKEAENKITDKEHKDLMKVLHPKNKGNNK